MIKIFKKLSAILIITLLIGISSVFASGKMEVKIGENVDLKGESTAISAAVYKWVLKKGKTILKTQNGQNFQHKFLNQGEYEVELEASNGSKSEGTSVNVLVGERYKSKFTQKVTGSTVSLYLILETLPERNVNGQVMIFGDSGKVHFLMEQSVGSILEYRIDKNIYEDSDGNGVANDDIDNSNDNSYLTGSAWSATYKKGKKSQIAAQITLVDKSGQKVKELVEIVFKDQIKKGDPTAILDIAPASNPKDGLVHLYKKEHKVGFYPGRSTGEILEYRIDKNIFVDSDSDGNPKNDIDNIKDISFKTGDVWVTSYKKTESQIISQLIVVGKNGKGSRVQKGIVFGKKPTPPAPSLSAVKDGITLTADKNIVIKDDPITFKVTGLKLGLSEYVFKWDLDGDGKIDKETNGVNSVKHSYTKPGVVKIKVSISDKKKNTLDKTLEITVKDTVSTKADFTYKTDGNKITFTNLSTASYSLASKQLNYEWSFGDTDSKNYEAQKNKKTLKSPTYSYVKSGKYVVVLKITDADNVTDNKTESIEIKKGGTSSATPGDKKSGSIFVKLLKILLYLILIVIVLVVLIVGGFLIFLKVQSPDLTFGELVDQLKVKILTKIGVHDEEDEPMHDESADMPPPPSEAEASDTDAINDESDVETIHESSTDNDEITADDTEKPPLAEESGPTPSWMQDKDVIEGEEDTGDDKSDVETQDPASEDENIAEDEELSDDELSDDESDVETIHESPTDEEIDELSDDESEDAEVIDESSPDEDIDDTTDTDELTDEDYDDEDFSEDEEGEDSTETPEWLQEVENGADEDSDSEDVEMQDLASEDEDVTDDTTDTDDTEEFTDEELAEEEPIEEEFTDEELSDEEEITDEELDMDDEPVDVETSHGASPDDDTDTAPTEEDVTEEEPSASDNTEIIESDDEQEPVPDWLKGN